MSDSEIDSNDRLKPCPFCGKQGVIDYIGSGNWCVICFDHTVSIYTGHNEAEPEWNKAIEIYNARCKITRR